MSALIRRPAVWMSALGVTALAVAGGVVMQSGQSKAKTEPSKAAPTGAYAAVAEGKADVEGGIIQVASRTAGVVREVTVLEGDKVSRGQVLARQEDDAPRLALQTAEANLGQARAQLGVTEVQLTAARRERARLESLSGVVSGQQTDQAADAIASAQATLASERAAIAVAETQVSEARYRLEQTIVRAEVTESALPSVKLGQTVAIVPETDQSKSYPGKVLRQAAVYGARKLQSDDPAERTDEKVVEVVVSADNAPLLIGQRVLVKFVK